MSGPWNPRYVAYATAHGRDPDAMLAHDVERWPGGKMTGFLLWIGERWATWDAQRGQGRDHVRGDAEIKAFDAWLSGSSTRSLTGAVG